MPRDDSSASTATARPIVERLEGRRLFAVFAPIVTNTPLVADGSIASAARTDANLIDPRGISLAPDGSLWVASHGTGTSTVYSGGGVPQPSAGPLVVKVPGALGTLHSAPTGMVRHAGGGFVVSAAGKSAPSSFLYATDGGIIAGWAAAVDPANAITGVDHSASGDVFKGLATIGTGPGARIYATDFHNGRVEVFNSRFNPVALRRNAFTDIQVPAGYAPFGIQVLKNNVYVTYARQDAARLNDNAGPAQGIVDMYSPAGKLLRRVGTGGDLNSPWGLAIAPSTWGVYKNDLLVGNNGDGTISIFDKHDTFLAQVLDPASPFGAPLTIDGLWGLAIGKGKAAKTLFYTSGPSLGAGGLFGSLTATRPKRTR